MSYNATSIFLFVSFLHLLKKGLFFFFLKYNTVRYAATKE